jgi:hypothetical protein
MPSDTGDPLSCSFCQKSQSVVGKLISNPSPPRVYICDECIAVCAYVLEDDRAVGIPMHPTGEPHPLLTHPLASKLLSAIERWIQQESLGGDGAEEIAEMRALATQVMANQK